MVDEELRDAQGEEFAREVLSRIPLQAVDDLLRELEARSQRFQTVLARPALVGLDHQQARSVLRSVFGVRRRAEAILEGVGLEELRRGWSALLYDPGPLEERFTAFCERFAPVCPGEEAIDLAGESLHFVFPHRWWLWTRWIWNPRTQTGALRFLVPDGQSLAAGTWGQVYLKVGEAVAYAEAARDALGLFTHVQQRQSPFLNDVHLAVVYTLYMFTTLRMRMTREFTRLLPSPWELVRRLLGLSPGEEWDAKDGAGQSR